MTRETSIFFRKRKSTLRFFGVATLLIIFYNEYLVYFLAHSVWNSIECRKDRNCTRLLFVADPQLLGTENDKAFYSHLAIWDSDRYVRKTFGWAMEFSKPDIICFMGDLLDEGNTATAPQYSRYVDRFRKIFQIPENVKQIHIPGDNDIGGENGEFISNANVRRFELEFMNNDIFDYENRLRFFKINRMLIDFTNPDKDNNPSKIRIGLSHMPVNQHGGPLQRSVLNDLDPHVIFTAHWHDSRIFIYPSTGSIVFNENAVKTFDLQAMKKDHTYLEIMIPTSSYRMGKFDIGYGFGVLEDEGLDKNIELRYTVFWNPSRFRCLKLYAIWLTFLVVYYTFSKCVANCRKSSRKHSLF